MSLYDSRNGGKLIVVISESYLHKSLANKEFI